MKKTLKLIVSALGILVLTAFGWAEVVITPTPTAFFTDFSTVENGTTTTNKQLSHCGVTLTLPAGITKNDDGTINLEKVGATLTLPFAVTDITVVLDLAEVPGTGTLVHFKAGGNISAYSSGTQITGYWGESPNGTAVAWTPAATKFLAATSATGGTKIIAGDSTYTNGGLKSGTNTYQTIYIGSYNNSKFRVADLTLRAIYVYTSYQTSMPTITDITAYTREITNGEVWNTVDWSVGGASSDVTNPSGVATLTVTESATLTLDEDVDLCALSVTGGNPLTLSGSSSLTISSTEILTDTDLSKVRASLGSVYIGEGATLTVGTNTTWTSMSGKGTLLCKSRLPNPTTGLTTRNTWAGTVKIDYPAAQVTSINLSNYGNADSIIELGDIGSNSTNSYFADADFTVVSDIVLSGNVHIRDGYSGKSYTFSGDLRSKSDTEKGTFNFNRTNGSNAWIFRGDLSGFTGEFNVGTSVACSKYFYFVGSDTPASGCEQGCFLINDTTAVLNGTYATAPGKTMTVKSGADIKGSGTLSTTLVLEAGTTVDLTDGLTVSNKVTLPTTGDVAIKVPTLPTAETPIAIFGDGATATNTGTAILEDAEGNKCVATIATADGGTGVVATRCGEMLTTPEITVNESVSLSSALGNNRLDIENLNTLTITFSAEGQVFTFDNTTPLNFTSITVNGAYAGTIQMADTAASVATTTTILTATATFDANSNLSLGTVSGSGQLKLAENSVFALSNANTYDGGTEIAAGATLTISNPGALGTTGAITGEGKLVLNYQLTGTDSTSNPATIETLNQNGLTDNTKWTGTVEVTRNGNMYLNFASLGNNQSTVRLSGFSGYTAQGLNEGTLMDTNIEVVGENGLVINNGNSGNLTVVTGELSGDGTITMEPGDGVVASRLLFQGGTGRFTGDITIDGGSNVNKGPGLIFGTASAGTNYSPYALTLGSGDTAISSYNPNGKISIAPGAMANVVGEWSATYGVHVYGSLGGTGTISSALTFADGAMLDASVGTLTANSTVIWNGTPVIKVPEDFTDWTTGICVLKTAATNVPTSCIVKQGDTTLTTVTLKSTTIGEVAGIYAVKPTVPSVLIGEGESAEEITVDESNITAIQEAAVAVGVTEVTSIVGATTAVNLAGLELFEDVSVEVDTSTKIATIGYAFGISNITVDADGMITVTAMVSNLDKSEGPTFADGVNVKLYSDETEIPSTVISETDTTIVIKSTGSILSTLEENSSSSKQLIIKATK